MAGPHCSVALLDRLGVVSVHDASCQRRDPQMFLSWQIPVDASPISRMRCRLPLMADGRWWMATQGTKRRPYQQRADMCWRVIGLAARDEMNWNPGRLFSSVNSSNSSDGHDGIRGRDPGWAIGCVAIGSVAVGRSATSNQVRGECCSGTQPASTKHRRLQFLQWHSGALGWTPHGARVTARRRVEDRPREGMSSGWLTASNGLRHANATAPHVGQLSFAVVSLGVKPPCPTAFPRTPMADLFAVVEASESAVFWGTWGSENLGRDRWLAERRIWADTQAGLVGFMIHAFGAATRMIRS